MTDNSASDSERPEEPIPGYKTISDFTKDGYKFLMEGIKYANQLPMGRDRNFYSTFDSFAKVLNEESHQLMNGITAVLKKNEVGANMRNQHIDKKSEILIDANDIILERVANNIDEINGIKKTIGSEPVSLQTVSIQTPVNINGSWNRSSNIHASVSSSSTTVVVSQQTKETTIRLLAAENIVKPQKFFTDKINNCHDDPWEPKIKDKPNSLKPLAIFLEETDVGREYSHPYEYELDRFTPYDELLTKTQLNKPKLIKDTPLIEINESSQLSDLVEELRKHKIIAVDLEHHSYRSFMGITCLMQISTQDNDYLIDTLALRNDLWILNEIFTKADIVKIFHGAQSDILWLQRDLSLYVVNMFDTYFAAKQLEYAGLSLAFLMNRFCNFVPNKQFQLADWRMRPLPIELKNYAREDTHYLIYIYQNMRNELIDRAHGEDNLLQAVINNSTNLCKKRYFKPTWHENIHLEFYSRCSRNFDNRQLFALKEIYKWRDQVARMEDESFSYVLPNNMLLEIAERLPKEMQGILACCSPVPPLVRANLLEIHKIILKALEQPFEQPILKENTRSKGSTTKITKIDVDSPLYCPHDMTRNEEYRDDLPTLITAPTQQIIQSILSAKLDIEQHDSICSIFNFKTDVKCVDSPKEKDREFKNNLKFLEPFKRYKLVRPFIKAKEKKLAAEKAKQEEEAKKKEEDKKRESATYVTTPVSPATELDLDIRTDEQRIESVREHFLQLARKSAGLKQTQKKSLLELGGSKKIKRVLHTENLHSDYIIPENALHTPIPNLQITIHTSNDSTILQNEKFGNVQNNKKRKFDDYMGDPGPSNIPKRCKREVNKNKMRKRKAKKALAIMRNSEGLGITETAFHGEAENIKTLSPKGKAKRRTSRGGKNRRQKMGNSNLNNNKNNNQQSGRETEFSAYDYSIVDFRQFQGGAHGAQKAQQFKAKFKGKGKSNKRGGKGNKAISFGRGKGH